MQANILSIGTAVPRYTNRQKALPAQLIQRLKLSGELASKLEKIFLNSCIEQRYSVLADFVEEGESGLFPEDLSTGIPGTFERNGIYKREAPKLALLSARRALEQWGGPLSEITHVISVSCTGMMTPGIECHLIRELGLSSACERFGINFMGCFGAFRGLAVAGALAVENPSHRVLVVCTELCTLHFQSTLSLETFVANALFADGSAAAVVGADQREGKQARFRLVRRCSMVLPDTDQEMTWEPGNFGYVMTLTEEVPKQIRSHIRRFVERLVGTERPLDSFDWAVHPGGKAILHAVAIACGLTRDHLQASWEVLRAFGNMSSPTTLFILDHLRFAKNETVALSFGPGLSVEGMLLAPL